MKAEVDFCYVAATVIVRNSRNQEDTGWLTGGMSFLFLHTACVLVDCSFSLSSFLSSACLCTFDIRQFSCIRKALKQDRLVGLVVKASASRAEDPGFESRLRRDFFRGRVIPVTSKLALQWLPFQAPGVIGSALGLIGPVLVYCDWVRWKAWSATSISVWQHVKLSEQIRP